MEVKPLRTSIMESIKTKMAFYLCLANCIVLISVALDFRWWDYNNATRITSMFVCWVNVVAFLGMMMKEEYREVPFFYDRKKRIVQWSNYTESASNHYEMYAKFLCNFDNVLIKYLGRKNDYGEDCSDYLRVEIGTYKDTMKYTVVSLKNILEDRVVYSEKNSDGLWYAVKELDKTIKSNGGEVVEVCNGFGEAKWRLTGKDKKPSKIRSIVPKLYWMCIIVVFITLLFAPIIVIARDIFSI